MLSETEIFMLGFIGGIIGASSMILISAYHYKQIMHDYMKAKYQLKQSLDTSSIKDELTSLKMQVTALQSQFGINE